MHLPFLQPEKENTEVISNFFGYNHNERLRPGEFYDMQNLTSDLFPILSPRKKRRVLLEGASIQALADRDGLAYVDRGSLYLNGKKQDLRLSDQGEKQLISMGAYLIILPDQVYINTADPEDRGTMGRVNVTAAPVLLCQCTLDGSEIVPTYSGPETPEKPADRSWWLDPQKGELKQYSEASGLWVLLETPYVKLSCPGIGVGFSPYDGVTVTGDPGLQSLSGAQILHDCGDDYLVFPGVLSEKKTLNLPITVARKIPRMDFCVESGNRLWGCRYGPDDQGRVVNEIYCSKLGDFRNFSCFLGISTDSYTVSLGSEGPFTGASSYGGYPLFFKENCMHKVFGTQPADFRVSTTACRGVEQGSSHSLAVCNEVLYYKSPEGICAYDGSLPRCVSEALGKVRYKNAAGGALRGKYYVSMAGENGRELLVFDTEKGLWHKEDDLKVTQFCRCRDQLFCADESGRLLCLQGETGKEEEEPVAWAAETGMIGALLPGNKYLSRISLRMQLEPGTRVSVLLQYDSFGPFELVGTVTGFDLRSFVFPVLPRRCDHLRLRLEGQGNARIYSAARVLKLIGEGTMEAR